MKTAPMKKVTMNQKRSRSTSPRSAAKTPSWQVTLDRTRITVNGAAVLRSRTTSFGGQFGSLTARTVKYIGSDDSHTITPTLTRLGRLRDPWAGAGSIAVAEATGGFCQSVAEAGA